MSCAARYSETTSLEFILNPFKFFSRTTLRKSRRNRHPTILTWKQRFNHLQFFLLTQQPVTSSAAPLYRYFLQHRIALFSAPAGLRPTAASRQVTALLLHIPYPHRRPSTKMRLSAHAHFVTKSMHVTNSRRSHRCIRKDAAMLQQMHSNRLTIQRLPPFQIRQNKNGCTRAAVWNQAL